LTSINKSPNKSFRISNSELRNLAVILLTWNGKSDTLDCLASLEAAGHPAEGEVFIVVDNGSEDGTLEAVAERFPWAQRLQNGANLGFAGGNNAGLRWALGKSFDWILLLNNDTIAAPDLISQLMEAAQKENSSKRSMKR